MFPHCGEAGPRGHASANFRREVWPSNSYQEYEHAPQFLFKSHAPSWNEGSAVPWPAASYATALLQYHLSSLFREKQDHP